MTVLLLLSLQAGGDQEIRAWIHALGSEKIDDRNRATERLLDAGDAAEAEVREALASADAEVRERCRLLLQAMEFESGAGEIKDAGLDRYPVRSDPDLQKQYEALACAGKFNEIADEDYRWLTCAIDGLLSDRKPVAFASLALLRLVLARRPIGEIGSALSTSSDLKEYRRARRRAAEYACWARWYVTEAASIQVSEWMYGPDPNVEDWEGTLKLLRGGGFDDRTTPRFGTFRRVKRMGSSAYPFLIPYIDHEDPALGAAAVDVLKRMTGRESPPVTAETKAAVKATWDRWLKMGGS